VEFAHALGAGVVNHYLCFIDLPEDFTIAELMPYVEPAVKLAEDLKVTLALENESIDATRTPEKMLEILKGVDSPHFKTNFDYANYFAASGEGFPWAYEILKDYIAYVHLKDGCFYNEDFGHHEYSKGWQMTGFNEGRYIYHPKLGEGALNYSGMLIRLQKDEYSGFCTLEPHTTVAHFEEYLRDESMYLRSLGFFKS
jgi:sugar phosphate isomerase/epimerase